MFLFYKKMFVYLKIFVIVILFYDYSFFVYSFSSNISMDPLAIPGGPRIPVWKRFI